MEKPHKHDNKVCIKLLDQLSDYIDGRLSPHLCEDIEQHLENCDNCMIVVDTLRKTVDLYKQTSQDEKMPTDVRRRLFMHLKLEDYVDSSESE
jgi:anti-sigma factor (TIGR02949 family)